MGELIRLFSRGERVEVVGESGMSGSVVRRARAGSYAAPRPAAAAAPPGGLETHRYNSLLSAFADVKSRRVNARTQAGGRVTSKPRALACACPEAAESPASPAPCEANTSTASMIQPKEHATGDDRRTDRSPSGAPPGYDKILRAPPGSPWPPRRCGGALWMTIASSSNGVGAAGEQHTRNPMILGPTR
jgi:hypothetical protein